MTHTDFSIDQLMTIDQAVKRWPDKFSRDELSRAARAKILRHIRKGRRKLITEAWLNAYLARGEVEPCPDDNDKKRGASSSADTGSSSKAKAGAAPGMTSEQEESAADLLAQKIMKKPKGG